MSSSTTLIRVKRRRSQSPADALLVHLGAKRPRGEGDAVLGAEATAPEASSKKIFRFAATVTDPFKASDDKSLCQIVGDKEIEVKQQQTPIKSKPLIRTPLKEKTRHTQNIHDSQKETLESSRSESRFKVVSTRRNLDSNEEKLFHLLDLVQEDEEKQPVEKADAKSSSGIDKISCNGVELTVAEKPKLEYVYDVYYYTQPKDLPSMLEIDSPDSIDQIEKVDSQTADEIYRLEMNDLVNYQDDRDFEAFEEDSDSNDEGNWRNEYPDEDDDDFSDYDEFGVTGGRGRAALADQDGDSDLDQRFGKMGVRGDDGEDLSSDGEDELVYSRTFERDANLHGTDYAKYKHKILARDHYFETKSTSEEEEEEEF